MNRSHVLSRPLCVLAVATAVGVAACERTGPVAAPNAVEAVRQNSSAALTTLRFEVYRQSTGLPIQNATISVYLNPNATTPPTLCQENQVVSTTQNCWLLTDATGHAQIQVPNGTPVGYLVRVLPPEWLTQLTSVIVPPVTPGGSLTNVPNDLGAVTCGPTGVIPFSPSALVHCVNNQYLTANGNSEVVLAALPTVTPRTVIVNDLQGNPVSNGVHTYLIEELPQAFPWMNLPAGVKPGFLSFYNPAGNPIPGHGGHLEVYGESPDGFEIAGTLEVTPGSTPTTVETSSVICANGTENVAYTINRLPTNPAFTFTNAIWAYNAKRSPTAALAKDLTTTTLVLKFAQAGGPVTVNINQRMRTSSNTRTASVSVQCTDGDCDVANATFSTPGGGNPMQPHLYQPKPGKLLFVVEGIDPNAVSEWTAKASKGTKGVDQLPVPSRGNASSAYALFSKAFTFCDPDFSFDGGWGCSI